MSKQIYTICIDCGNKYGTRKPMDLNAWVDTCDMCAAENVTCAAAGHDFGIYNNETEKKEDSIQREI